MKFVPVMVSVTVAPTIQIAGATVVMVGVTFGNGLGEGDWLGSGLGDGDGLVTGEGLAAGE
jgi:hypothetical protein